MGKGEERGADEVGGKEGKVREGWEDGEVGVKGRGEEGRCYGQQGGGWGNGEEEEKGSYCCVGGLGREACDACGEELEQQL